MLNATSNAALQRALEVVQYLRRDNILASKICKRCIRAVLKQKSRSVNAATVECILELINRFSNCISYAVGR